MEDNHSVIAVCYYKNDPILKIESIKHVWLLQMNAYT